MLAEIMPLTTVHLEARRVEVNLVKGEGWGVWSPMIGGRLWVRFFGAGLEDTFPDRSDEWITKIISRDF